MAETALITGASSGIGMELAGVLAREGYDLVIVGRDTERLAKVREALVGAYGVAITSLPLDLAASGAPEALFDALKAQDVTVDVLVNNAGVGDFGRFVESEVGRIRAMIRTNVTVPTVLSRLIGAGMADRGKGKILNVASVAGFVPGPWMAAYFATKAHVLSLSEALAVELKGKGVTVTALCPGPTQTRFIERAGQERSRLIKGKRLASAKDVAEFGYKAMRKGKRVAVHGLRNKATVLGIRLLPRGLVARLVERAQAPI